MNKSQEKKENVISFASKILEGLKQAELDKGLAVNIL